MNNLKRINSSNSNSIAISVGDPAGIGIEVTLKALFKLESSKKFKAIVVGCKKSIINTYSKLKEKGINKIVDPNTLDILDIPISKEIVHGKPSLESGKASFEWLTAATRLVMQNKVKALVTAPIAKSAWHEAGHFYPGQTERLAELSQSKNVSMLFTAISPNNGWRFNTLLATTHIPLCEVNKKLNPEIIYSKLDTLLSFCKEFNEKPKLAITGLNPHAGEEGNLGNEETEWLIPTINNWKKSNPDIQLDGPIPPDTCWIPSANAWMGTSNLKAHDGILALYHDQGLIPVKLIAFDYAVNTTLGMPFIRTSPDHGTGFDIAGKGIARPTSMIEAIQTALDLQKN